MKEVLKLLEELDNYSPQMKMYSINVHSDWSGDIMLGSEEVASFHDKKEAKYEIQKLINEIEY